MARTEDERSRTTTVAVRSEAEARDFLRAKVAADPSLAGNLHVLPNHEVNEAAAA